jgi:chitinase
MFRIPRTGADGPATGSPRGWRWLAPRIALPVAAATIAGVAVVAGPAGAAGGLSAATAVSSHWDTGFEATLTVSNSGTSAVNGWRVELDLPANEAITSAWNTTMTRSGNHYVFVNADWNGTVNPGAGVSAGLEGTGPPLSPTSCTVNGGSCGGGGTTTPPTTTPPTTTPPTTTPPTSPPPGNPGPFNKVGYFAQWGIYGRNFPMRNVETSGAAGKLTAINYAFSNISADGRCVTGDSFADWEKTFPADQAVSGVGDTFDQPLAGNLNQIKELKARHPNLSALISIGGWTWSRNFSDVALTAASRQTFVSSCIDLWIRGNLPTGAGRAAGVFDGVDIDWEWPGSAGNDGNIIRAQDKQDYTLLLAEFRRQLDALGAQNGRHYRLTAFLPADPAKIDAGFEVGPVFNALDAGLVQGYDFHGAWESTTNHQSNLFNTPGDPSGTGFSDDSAVKAWRSRGAPAAKVVLGSPAYGRGWQGVPNGGRNGLFQPGTAAPGTFEAGIEDYKVLATRAGTRFRDTATGALYLYDGNQWWSYDDPALMTQKANYVKQNGLGGMMMWELDGDDSQASLVSAIDATLR